ncbi:MAG: hypothetical protein HFJ30_02785 [Clostridia bacterium]|nr:hypothetical protein [Clostridia bacterium]
MKVLFAVNNENISESIIKRYQQDYKEIISAKNVYYFNAIVKELQRDKTYDRIVISEDLEPFSNNNYDAIDKFIFDKMDNISDEATNQSGNDIPIILICADRREKSEPLLVKLFGIGVYNALLGKDRSITTVCELLNRPRGKKEAKSYYRIDAEDVDYKVENEGDVSEAEIQNILNHYKKLGKNEDKYVESFEHIASQYTDAQLRLIAKFLPLGVKAVLEANSPKYQEAVSFGTGTATKKSAKEPSYGNAPKNSKPDKKAKNVSAKKEEPQLEFIEKNLNQNRITEPVVIPSAINPSKVRKMEEPMIPMPEENTGVQGVDDILGDITAPVATSQPVEAPIIAGFDDEEPVPVVPQEKIEEPQEVLTAQPKKRGRPKKGQEAPAPVAEAPKKKRGRPKKSEVEETTVNENVMPEAPVNLFELGEETTDSVPQSNNTSSSYSDMVLPGLDDENMYIVQESMNEQTEIPQSSNESINTSSNTMLEPQPVQVPMQEPIQTSQEVFDQENILEQTTPSSIPNFGTATTQAVQNTGKYNLSNTDLSGLLTRDKKVVAFVGTSKNGTSFLVNNLAEMLSKKGIKTALLDLTQNRNAYYIYTENEENLRQIAYSTMANLRRGDPRGIEVNKNLTVYTTLPGENEDINDYANILETLIKNYSLVLLDCDFETNYGYFKEAQEIYLVQSLDVLTIQPLTAFLRDLKAKNVLNPEKIRVVLNKIVKVRSITDKIIIGGMAYYNDPAMSFMTELFNKDAVPYCTIPFEEQAYSRYLEGLINCKISLSGYSKNFMQAFEKLTNMVYPLIGNGSSSNYGGYNNYAGNQTSNFSNGMNDTLNRMKNY